MELPLGRKLGLKIVVKKSEDESKVIIGGLDDLKVNKIISLLEKHIESLFDEGV